MIRPIASPKPGPLVCTCGHVLIPDGDNICRCEHTVIVVDNGVEQKILQLIRHRVAVTTELVGGGAE